MQRFLACNPSVFSDFGVPREAVRRFSSIIDSSSASEGTEIHALIEKAILDDCLHESVRALIPERRMHPECKLVYDLEAGIAGLHMTDWSDLDKSRVYLAGTADYIGISDTVDGKQGMVIDWKTGMAVPEAACNAQLYAAAAIYASIYMLESVILRVVYIDPQTLEAYDSNSYTATREELEEFLGHAVNAAKNPSDVTTVGPHCSYCPKAVVCPDAKESSERLMMGYPTGSPHALYASIQIMSEVLKSARGALNQIARERPIDLGNGVFYGDTPKKSISVPDGKRALPVLAEMLGEHCMEAVEVKTTSASIERATKTAGLPRGSVVKKLKSMGVYDDVPIGGGIKKFNK